MNIKQKKILNLLTIINGQRYSELYKHFIEEDKFPYHINQVIKKGFVNKHDGLYFLTREGAYTTQEFESSTLKDRRLSIPIYHLVCRFENKYLIRKCFSADIVSNHLYAIPGLKSDWGVKNADLFSTRMSEKIGVEGIPKYRATAHLLEFTSKGQIMWDDLIMIFDVTVTKIVKEFENLSWYSLDEIRALPKRHLPLDIYVLEDNHEPYKEIVMSDNFNLREEEL
jgi:hypothetical protein